MKNKLQKTIKTLKQFIIHNRDFILRKFGYELITVPGYHCGCCGHWVSKPSKYWRKWNRYRINNNIGLCDQCASGKKEISKIKSIVHSIYKYINQPASSSFGSYPKLPLWKSVLFDMLCVFTFGLLRLHKDMRNK